MRLLLDSHTVLWFIEGDPQLSDTARQHIEEPANEKWLSLANVWEIALNPHWQVVCRNNALRLPCDTGCGQWNPPASHHHRAHFSYPRTSASPSRSLRPLDCRTKPPGIYDADQHRCSSGQLRRNPTLVDGYITGFLTEVAVSVLYLSTLLTIRGGGVP
jgi:hypothetical protein